MSVAVAVGAWLVLAAFVLVVWPRINTLRSWRVGALLLTLAFSLTHQLLFGTVAEDAYISFRYSLNIAEGHGPVFNAGERVEGYSNFLWVITLALAKTVFGLGIVGTAVVLGVLCTLGSVLLAYALVNRVVAMVRPATPAFGLAAAVLTAGASGLAAYGPSGLETPLFLLLVLGICLAVAAERFVVAGVLVALATMTRPDGVVVAVIVGLWLLVRAARRRENGWALAGYVLGALVLVVPWTAWRVTYYGHFVPNALAAKSGAPLGWQLARGWDYLAGFVLAHQGFLLLAIAAVVALVLRRPATDDPTIVRARSLVWLLFAVATGYLAFMTYAGGDWMPAWRLLAPVPPLLAVASAAACGLLTAPATAPSPAKRPPRRRAVPLVPVVALALSGLSLIVSTVHGQMLPLMHEWRDKIAEMAEIGSWLGDRLPPGTVVSTFANGVLSYRAGTQLVMIDVLGLTDEHIARHGTRNADLGLVGHITTDYDYVVNVRRPALAVVTGSGYSDRQRCGADPVYAGRYEVATFRRAGTDEWVAVYPIAEQAASIIETLDADPRFEYVPCGT
ncbi:glycosyltransferase family 87 protein [Amycolatopsis arida]|uniref:glycosyltransferase family 87 protein n=1 Tax=Amycolatopsis arida TaxID=587909 RepID=UPI000B83F93D|nr:glycosyltransferase family 87 protein [Amycolatopsis arida]